MEEAYRLLRKECGGNECYKSMRKILGFFVNNRQSFRQHRTPENCDMINRLYYNNDKEDLRVPIYACWRDFMLIKSASMLQFIIEGVLVTSIYKHSRIKNLNLNNYLKNELYPSLDEALTRITYWSDKCLYE